MDIKEIQVDGYEKVVRGEDVDSGLKAYIAVHSTTLGPALGGIRMWPYASDDEALTDVLRLARGMTYKSALADTGLGGGKAVIIGSAQTDKSEALMQAMGQFIHSLEGRYIAAEDVGMTEADMVAIRRETPYVAGLPLDFGSSGNPAPFTAYGVFLGMRICLERALQTDRFDGVRVAIQGCGNVAGYLCQHLSEAGAVLTVADVAPEKTAAFAERYGAAVAATDDIHRVECEIFAPCALGGVINDLTIPNLGCRVVAGSANNQCWRPEHSDRLRREGILYAPDFVINAGGVMNIGVELGPDGYNEARVMTKMPHIATALRDIFDLAEREDIGTERAAIKLAERHLAAAHPTITKNH